MNINIKLNNATQAQVEALRVMLLNAFEFNMDMVVTPVKDLSVIEKYRGEWERGARVVAVREYRNNFGGTLREALDALTEQWGEAGNARDF